MAKPPPTLANMRPLIIRPYIICPDCGRSAPDAGDGLCQDCRDLARLRAAVGEWARHYSQLPAADPGRIPANLALAELARELGLVAP